MLVVLYLPKLIVPIDLGKYKNLPSEIHSEKIKLAKPPWNDNDYIFNFSPFTKIFQKLFTNYYILEILGENYKIPLQIYDYYYENNSINIKIISQFKLEKYKYFYSEKIRITNKIIPAKIIITSKNNY